MEKLEQYIPTEEDRDQEKAIELINEMDIETCLEFIKQCDGLDMLLYMDAHETVLELVNILRFRDKYPYGYSDFIKEVQANDFTKKL